MSLLKDALKLIRCNLKADESNFDGRYLSFNNFPYKNIFTFYLADAGFIYTGHKDVVKCIHCNQTIENWANEIHNIDNTKKIPTKLQKLHSLNNKCKINLKKTSAIQQSFFRPNESRPKNVQMTDFECRLSTYLTRNWKGVHKPDDMAEAGFYYCGMRDCVQCFHCGGMLQHWKKSENPLDEHALAFPNCDFIRRTIGDSKLQKLLMNKQDTTVRFENTLTDSKLNTFNSDDKSTCMFCCSRERQVAFVPCGHLVSCTSCSKELEKCPICRAEISQALIKFPKSEKMNFLIKKILRRKKIFLEKSPTTTDQNNVDEMLESTLFIDESKYRMNHKHRGFAVIINNKHFKQCTGMTDRDGTDIDADRLTVLLTNLQFKVMVHHNVAFMQLLDIIEQYSGSDHGNCDMFIFIVLSHGDEGIVFATDRAISIDCILDPFKNTPSLFGKPKLFIIQACRGNRYMEGVSKMHDAQLCRYVPKIPIESDCLLVYSTLPGYYSWRNIKSGSWFIQAFCQIFELYRHDNIEIMQLLTKVNRKVAYHCESFSSDISLCNKRQIPCIVSMLTKELYLNKRN